MNCKELLLSNSPYASLIGLSIIKLLGTEFIINFNASVAFLENLIKYHNGDFAGHCSNYILFSYHEIMDAWNSIAESITVVRTLSCPQSGSDDSCRHIAKTSFVPRPTWRND